MVRYLLGAGAEINKVRPRGSTWNFASPLACAVRAKQVDMVRFLLQHGGDPRVRDNDGRSALEDARATGHEEIIGLIEQWSPPVKRREVKAKQSFVFDFSEVSPARCFGNVTTLAWRWLIFMGMVTLPGLASPRHVSIRYTPRSILRYCTLNPITYVLRNLIAIFLHHGVVTISTNPNVRKISCVYSHPCLLQELDCALPKRRYYML